VTLADWLKGAQEHKGSWWPTGANGSKASTPNRCPRRAVGTEALPPIEEAPGSYVRVRA